MELRKHKLLRLSIVTIIALLSTWQGLRNLAWFYHQVFNQDCSASLLIKCK